jgi:hypothetical protein
VAERSRGWLKQAAASGPVIRAGLHPLLNRLGGGPEPAGDAKAVQKAAAVADVKERLIEPEEAPKFFALRCVCVCVCVCAYVYVSVSVYACKGSACRFEAPRS